MTLPSFVPCAPLHARSVHHLPNARRLRTRAPQTTSRRARARTRLTPTATWVKSSASLQVEADRAFAYDVYSNLQEMPKWSPWLREVHVDPEDNTLSTWHLSVRGVEISWKARITSNVRGEMFAWRSESGLRNRGSVHFVDTDKGSTVTLAIEFDVPDFIAKAFDSNFISKFVRQTLDSDLKRFRGAVLRSRRVNRIAQQQQQQQRNVTKPADGVGNAQSSSVSKSTADNVLSSTAQSNSPISTAAEQALADSDPEQARLMAEQVILVTPDDAVCGFMSKVDAHLFANDLPLHRAFSLFLFDKEGRMLLQKRAATKVTFPSHWTNTVCSHPLHMQSELDGATGAMNAAVRKIEHELGITTLNASDVAALTRVLYRSPSCDVWGEHELDYVLFAQKNVQIQPVANEVEEIQFVTPDELRELFAQAERGEVLLTPWFRYIVDKVGWYYWETLRSDGMHGVRLLADNNIYRFTESNEAQ